jgi:hypothetical protein
MTLETFGSLIKEENLRTVNDGIIPNTLVLENKDPFPGYYGAVPTDKVPDSFFLVMTKKESTEKILRLTDIIKKNSNIDFEGSPGRICIYNEAYFSIRIRGLSDFSKLEEIQAYYRDNGIQYMKKKSVDATSVIQIKKIFEVSKLNENILKDAVRDMYYLIIDKQLTWSHFRTLTFKVKNNLKNATFDAALAVIYGSEVLDLIRVYAKDIDMNQINIIHEKYKEFITKG